MILVLRIAKGKEIPKRLKQFHFIYDFVYQVCGYIKEQIKGHLIQARTGEKQLNSTHV